MLFRLLNRMLILCYNMDNYLGHYGALARGVAQCEGCVAASGGRFPRVLSAVT